MIKIRVIYKNMGSRTIRRGHFAVGTFHRGRKIVYKPRTKIYLSIS